MCSMQGVFSRPMIPRFLLSFVIALSHLCLASGQPAPEKSNNSDPPVPVVTQAEILAALGLEISKIRIVNIPKGEPVSLELIELTEPKGSRRLAHISLIPDSDWIELLISAQSEADGCRKFNMKLSHENPVFVDWSIDIEKQFGAGKRARGLVNSGGIINFDSNVFAYNRQTLDVAGFRLNSGNRSRRYTIELKTFSEAAVAAIDGFGGTGTGPFFGGNGGAGAE